MLLRAAKPGAVATPLARRLGLALWLLGLSACWRWGYAERPKPAADGGSTRPMDAGASPDASAPTDAASPDASTGSDASTSPDAALALDASTNPDASTSSDASVPMDASMSSDASMSTDASVTSDAAVGCTPSAARDYCLQLPALPQAQILDGTLDCGPTLIDLPVMGWNSSGSLPSDNHARYAAAWRPDGLYFYVEVDDPVLLPALASDTNPWCGDGVELYADADGKYSLAPDFDDPGTMQLLAVAPARDASTMLAEDALYHSRSNARAYIWDKARHVMVARTGGYALEAFIAAADLELDTWQLAAGGSVGFDIAINVSIPNEAAQKVECGYNLGQYYLRLSRTPCSNDNCRPFSNVAAFCNPVLE